MNTFTRVAASPLFAGQLVTDKDLKPSVLQYQARRLRGNYINRPGSRKKGRWQVVAVHRLPAINHTHYERLDMEPMARTDAIKIANTLNRELSGCEPRGGTHMSSFDHRRDSQSAGVSCSEIPAPEKPTGEAANSMNTDLTDQDLDKIKAALKAGGHPECSVYLLTHLAAPRAQCPPCGVWFAITEIEQAGGCPKCGQRGDFEVPDEYGKPSDSEAQDSPNTLNNFPAAS